MRTIVTAFLFLFASLGSVSAEWVRVKTSANQSGVGFLINYNGSCHVIAPFHVFSPSRVSSLKAAAMVKAGDTRAFQTTVYQFEKEYDIAIAHVEYSVEQCRTQWKPVAANMVEDRFQQAMAGRRNSVIRTFSDQSLGTIDIQLQSLDTFYIKLKLSRADEDIYAHRGISGSGVFIGNELVGIVQDVDDNNVVRALRVELIPLFLRLNFASRGAELSRNQSEGSQSSGLSETRVAATGGGKIYPEWETECDDIAANQGDPRRHPESDGRLFEEINAQQAIEACKRALKESAGSARLQYQYARALSKGLDEDLEGITYGIVYEQLSKALAMGHTQAITNMRNIMIASDALCQPKLKCERKFEKKLRSLQKKDPPFYTFELATIYKTEDYQYSTCGERDACDQTAAELFLSLEGTDFEDQGLAQAAYLSRWRNVVLPCDADNSCAVFEKESYEPAAANGVAWVQRNLGQHLWRNRKNPRVCDDEQKCVDEAHALLDKAIEQNDKWALSRLGDLYANRSASKFLNCGKTENLCTRTALSLYERALEAGETGADLNIVWLNLYRHKELECKEQDCIKTAYKNLTSDTDEETDWKQSLLAYGTDKFPQVFASYCVANNCKKTSFEYNKLAAVTRSYNAEYAAEQLLFENEKLDCGGELGCTAQAIDYAKLAFQKGDDSSFRDWSRALTRWAKADVPEKRTNSTTNNVIVVEDDFSIANYCQHKGKDCIDKIQVWISELPKYNFDPSYYGSSDIMELLVGVALMPGTDPQVTSMRATAKDMFANYADQAIAAGEMNMISETLYGLVYSCTQVWCKKTASDFARSGAEAGNIDMLSFLVEVNSSPQCETTQGQKCLSVPQRDILIWINEVTDRTALNQLANAVNYESTTKFAKKVESTLAAKGEPSIAAKKARGSIWRSDDTYMADSFTRSQAEKAVRDMLEFIAIDQNTSGKQGYASGAVAVLIARPADGWDKSMLADAMLLSLMMSDTYGGSTIERWMNAKVFTKSEKQRFQRKIGTNADGDFGRGSSKAAEQWRQRCICDGKSISALAASIVARLPSGR